MKMPATLPAIEPVMLQAEPQPLQIDLQRMAVVVVDMQNAFASEGGLLNLLGTDVSETPRIVETINQVTEAARAKGIRVICIVHHHSPDLREAGGPDAGYYYKIGLPGFHEHRDKCFVEGEWGAEIVKGLDFKENDIVVVKPRFSGFYGTNLDTILKTFNIKYLAFAGIATNICVEATIRDATNLNYFPILLSDATAPAGPPFLRDAAIVNVKMVFGWVTTSADLIKALKK